MTDTCAWCNAPKTSDSTCFRCGANYAKAEAIQRHGTAKGVSTTPTAAAAAEPQEVPLPVTDPAAEWLNCLLALPLLLLGAWACQYFNVFDGLQRIVFGMPVHEFGHAVTAWFTGHNAIPSLWVTRTSPERGYACGLLLLGIYGALIRYGHKRRQPLWYLAVAVLLLLQLYGTFVLRPVNSDMLIVFGGDGIGMVLATLMMSTFYLGKETQLYKGSVRWGLLFWGAAAFMDMFMAWWKGQSDIARVGYGTTGGRLTDAYRLINEYAWNQDEMIARHLHVGYACLLALAVIYGLGLRQAYDWLQQSRGN